MRVIIWNEKKKKKKKKLDVNFKISSRIIIISLFFFHNSDVTDCEWLTIAQI